MTKKAKVKAPLKFPCLATTQGKYQLVIFTAPAKQIWEVVDINRRDPDKRKGYQRFLSESRVEQISRYVDDGNAIPNSILLSLDKDTELSEDGTKITLPARSNAGWVIDGQHRLAGATEAEANVPLVFVAFINLPIERQIQQFVTINRTARGVPASLYYDLLKELPFEKKPADIAKEKAAAVADELRNDKESPFSERIVIVRRPEGGELSLNNFVRKLSPLLLPGSGRLAEYSHYEVVGILNNYYAGLTDVFPKYFEARDSMFFKTLGFGAMFNALPVILDITLKYHQGFAISDVVQVFKKIDYFDFERWERMGTGTQAERDAADDLIAELRRVLESTQRDKSVIRLA